MAPSRASLTDAVHDAILAWLMAGDVEPGQGLSIDGLARELDVSPTPVREALARLEPSGLVERVARRGYRAARALTVAEVHDLLDARTLIECRSTVVLAGRVDDDVLRRLAETQQRQRAAALGPGPVDVGAYHLADHEFHRTVNGAAGNAFLTAAFESLNGQVQRFRMGLLPHDGVTDADPALAEHAAVLDALTAGDAVRAETAMRAHLDAVRERALADLDAATRASTRADSA